MCVWSWTVGPQVYMRTFPGSSGSNSSMRRVSVLWKRTMTSSTRAALLHERELDARRRRRIRDLVLDLDREPIVARRPCTERVGGDRVAEPLLLLAVLVEVSSWLPARGLFLGDGVGHVERRLVRARIPLRMVDVVEEGEVVLGPERRL